MAENINESSLLFNINLPPDTSICDGKQITFKAPADSNNSTDIIINDITFTLSEADNKGIIKGGFKKDAMVSVVLDTVENKAFIINALQPDTPTVLTGILQAGETSITFTNNSITSESIIDVYTNIFGIGPSGMIINNGSVTISFDPQSTAINIRAEVRNIVV